MITSIDATVQAQEKADLLFRITQDIAKAQVKISQLISIESGNNIHRADLVQQQADLHKRHCYFQAAFIQANKSYRVLRREVLYASA